VIGSFGGLGDEVDKPPRLLEIGKLEHALNGLSFAIRGERTIPCDGHKLSP
jgi:hypothetical protein